MRPAKPPFTVLEVAAVSAAPQTFSLLLSHGALLTSRTLHRATEAGAWSAVLHDAAVSRNDPAEAELKSAKFQKHMGMISYLLEEVGQDINALDWDHECFKALGTPLQYVVGVVQDGGSLQQDLIRYLLQHGADVTRKSAWGRDLMQSAGDRFRPILLDLIAEHQSR